MLKNEPYVPTGIQIGQVEDDAGATLGVLTFETDDGEISVYINKQAADVLEKAVGRLQHVLGKSS
ncbi:hypothetical protein [Chelativorans sp. AA-79]|uniref:hypothetical protein n=1 Tax=Chelativorans sp. AA-79 TaxID=3028735 RepID=UPI0023F95EFE|nr:hypothetical protein [Chelativorans sp. AA-79]WEX10259.1 hypothetical protein PVE73_04680 [Chelativorans sp. AA-79]